MIPSKNFKKVYLVFYSYIFNNPGFHRNNSMLTHSDLLTIVTSINRELIALISSLPNHTLNNNDTKKKEICSVDYTQKNFNVTCLGTHP